MSASPDKDGLLQGARVYLSGPMDFVASRAAEKQFGWRNRVSQFLQFAGVTVFDPWFKPDVRGLHEYGLPTFPSRRRLARGERQIGQAILAEMQRSTPELEKRKDKPKRDVQYRVGEDGELVEVDERAVHREVARHGQQFAAGAMDIVAGLVEVLAADVLAVGLQVEQRVAVPGQCVRAEHVGRVVARDPALDLLAEIGERDDLQLHGRPCLRLEVLDQRPGDLLVGTVGEWAAAVRLRDITLTPLTLPGAAEVIAATRAALGEATFKAAWAAGQALTPAEAIAEALQDDVGA